jgi:hypothetical protein
MVFIKISQIKQSFILEHMVTMDKSEVMGSKKILQKFKIWEDLDYYHNLLTITAWPSITTYFREA